MSGQFELRVGDRVVRAELLADQAPHICRAFEAMVPLDSYAVHAKFAGDELIVMLPFAAPPENEAGAVAPGDIGYYPSRQTLCLFYGDITPFASVTRFARVLPEDLPAARAVGEAVLAAGVAPVRITMAGRSPASGHPWPDADPVRAGTRSEAGLVERLRAATRAIWLAEPPDVSRLRTLKRPPMGTMPCVVYANFDLFWAGENLQVCRSLAQAGALSALQVGLTTAALLRQAAMRLSKWGFPETIAVIEAVAAELEAPSGPAARAETLHAVIDGVQLYLNRLQSWVDAGIPWSAMDEALRLLPAPAARARAPV